MKKVFTAILFLLITVYSQAQISEGGTPKSFTIKNLTNKIQVIEFLQPSLENKDTNDGKNGVVYEIGKSVFSNITTENSGTWTETEDGKIWQLAIKINDAKALGLYFDAFYLPEGSKLFVYSKDKFQVIGAFTEKNNPVSGFFATELIEGDYLFVEYNEPLHSTQKPVIHISEIAYIYHGVQFHYIQKSTEDFGDALSCMINVNCSPEGINWQDEKKGVVRILVKAGYQYGWCSGSLINNVRQDFTPYMLSADHCAEGSSTSDFNQWIFYFNYETSGCSNPSSEPSSNTMTGCTKKANGGSGGDTGSDFLLLQLNNSVPQSYNAYFNGWNRVNTASSSGVGIHHPGGDIKKISTYSNALVSSQWSTQMTGTHWRLTWSSTTNGHSVTQGGSSGSPLFDNNGRIVGTLTGGATTCQQPNLYDYYGKFSYHWESNGTTASTHLKEWLDPDNTAVTTLNGVYNIVQINGLASTYCVNNAAVTLTGIPSGGTFTGVGISGNTFNPSNAGVGTYTVTYTATYGSVSQTVTVYAVPTVNLGSDITIPSGQTVTLIAGSGFSTYLWSNAATTQSITVGSQGTYSVTVSNSAGCTSSDIINVTVSLITQNPGWNFTITNSNHTILIPNTIPITIDGISIVNGDYIGVFFDSLGTLACAGYMQWSGTTNALTAWGEDVSTGGHNGFATGEIFKWKIWKHTDFETFDATATYSNAFLNSNTFSTNGISGLTSLIATNSVQQIIALPSGWSLFSTYIIPQNPDISSVVSSIVANVSIVKSENGNVYWPQYSVNSLGNMQIGKGYQIRMISAQNLIVSGTAAIPESTSISLSSGWGIIGYLRQSQGAIPAMLASILNKIMIMKDSNGNTYWPQYGIDQIINLNPGKAYQINLNSSGALIYPPN